MKLTLRTVVFLSFAAAASGIQPGANVVEFSEVSFPPSSGPFPLLTGSTAYQPFGLSFQGSAHRVVDARFTSAGSDNVGVAAVNCPSGTACFEPAPTNSFSFVFDDGAPDFGGALSAKFYWIALGASGGSTIDVVATWFDSAGNVIATDHMAPAPTPGAGFISGQFSHSALSSAALIRKVTFTGAAGSLGVGRVEFNADDSTRTVRADNTPSADLTVTDILCPASVGANARAVVCNVGTLTAAASTTAVMSIADLGGVMPSSASSSTVATGALGPQQCAVVSASVPQCIAGRCEITANANSGATPIPETNMTNNKLTFSCVVGPR
ncbi:MAG TPA: hypothetical protein VGF59_13015 [Bryobacteraceae bacterium]|jgi:hypothetical protein